MMISLLTLACLLSLSNFCIGNILIGPTDINVKVTGRTKTFISNDYNPEAKDSDSTTGLQFDHIGVSFAVNVIGASDVSILLSQFQSSDLDDSLYYSYPSKLTNSRNQNNHKDDDNNINNNTSTGNNYFPSQFKVLINGKIVKIFNTSQSVNNSITTYTLGTGLENNIENEIRVVKMTEAEFNDINVNPNYLTFYGFIIDQGHSVPFFQTNTIQENNSNNLMLGASPARIEFVGDSITAGFCNLCPSNESQNSFIYEDFSLSWPYLTCDHFHADCHYAAWSGFGVIRNCCGGNTLMPSIYFRSLASDNSTENKWDFSSWIPDIVVINLGTNDHLDSTVGPVETNFIQTYTDFVVTISKNYNKTPTFLLACGPMDENYCPHVTSIINNLNTNFSINAVFLNHTKILNSSNTCCGHPSAAADQLIAQRTIQAIQSLNIPSN